MCDFRNYFQLKYTICQGFIKSKNKNFIKLINNTGVSYGS